MEKNLRYSDLNEAQRQKVLEEYRGFLEQTGCDSGESTQEWWDSLGEDTQEDLLP
jgi:hypothetical protein